MQTKRMRIFKKIIILALIFIAMPVTIITVYQVTNNNFYITSTLLLIFATLAFFLSFEERKPQPREIVVLAVMCAIAAVSRIVFQPIPFVSPLVGFVIITAVTFGPQAGFMCGALSAIISNFSCGQGPWTPWQMFAFGLAGLIVGAIYKIKTIPKNKVSLTIIGFLAVQFIVGPLLDLSSIFYTPMADSFTLKAYVVLLSSGFIVNLIHASSVAITIYFLSDPMFDKLDRIKTKYGLMG